MYIHLVGIRADLLCVEPLQGNSNEQEQAVGTEPHPRRKNSTRHVCRKVGQLRTGGEEGREGSAEAIPRTRV